MIWMVISFNIALALLCLWVAWQLCRFRRLLRGLNQRFAIAAQVTDKVLHPAPDFILRGQQGVQRGRAQVAQGRVWQQQMQSLLSLLGVAQWLYRRTLVPSGSATRRRSRQR